MSMFSCFRDLGPRARTIWCILYCSAVAARSCCLCFVRVRPSPSTLPLPYSIPLTLPDWTQISDSVLSLVLRVSMFV